MKCHSVSEFVPTPVCLSLICEFPKYACNSTTPAQFLLLVNTSMSILYYPLFEHRHLEAPLFCKIDKIYKILLILQSLIKQQNTAKYLLIYLQLFRNLYALSSTWYFCQNYMVFTKMSWFFTIILFPLKQNKKAENDSCLFLILVQFPK